MEIESRKLEVSTGKLTKNHEAECCFSRWHGLLLVRRMILIECELPSKTYQSPSLYMGQSHGFCSWSEEGQED